VRSFVMQPSVYKSATFSKLSALVFRVDREGDLARAKADVDDFLTVGLVLRMGAQNACIALPARYIE
jgi:hypothetical protein